MRAISPSRSPSREPRSDPASDEINAGRVGDIGYPPISTVPAFEKLNAIL